MAVILIMLFVLFAIVAIACGIWQINLAVNHPEKSERLKKWKKDYVEEQAEMRRVIVAAGETVAGVVSKCVKK